MKKLLPLFIAAMLVISTQAQTYNMPTSGTVSVTTCSGTLYDDGGTGTYSYSANGILTISPSTPGSYVQLTFTSFQTEYGYDYLYVYDGTGIGSPQLGTYNSGSTVPGTIYATNTSGALTLRFTTDGSGQYSGFEAAISCVTSIPNSDLVITSPVLNNPISAPGYSVSVSCYITNSSSSLAASSRVGYYLSTDTAWDAGDVYLNFSSGNTLAAFSSSSRSSTLSIPVGTALGNYYILYYADYSNLVAEDFENNNVAYKPITISSAVPDLYPGNMSLGATIAYPTATVNVSCYVYNQGIASSTISSLGYYLSVDSLWDATDTLLTSSTGSSISAGSYSYRSGTITVPFGTALGNYYVLFVTDYTQIETEALEINNVRALPFRVAAARPDLVPYTPLLNQTLASPGTYISGSVQVKNDGGLNAPSSNLGLYLSTDSVFSGTDIYLTSLNTSSINPGASANISFSSVLIPVSTPVAHYYLLYYADYLDILNEISDSNNVVFREIDVVAPAIDLLIQTPSTSVSSVSPGGSLTAYCYIYNGGTSNSPGSSVGYYLSNDSVWDAGDVYLNAVTGSSLNYGSSSYRTSSLTIPIGTSLGAKYIIYFADYQNQINEFLETNNTNFRAITIVAPYVDFSISSTSFTSSLSPGGSATATCYINNNGNSNFTSTAKLGYYLSTNTTFDSSDVLIDSLSFTNITAGNYYYATKTITIPLGTAVGNYYLLSYADFRQTVPESNDSTNNVGSRSFTVVAPYIDFQVSSTSFASSIAPGGSATAYCYVYNYGNTNFTSSSKLGFYLSANSTLDGSDMLIDSLAFSSIAAGDYSYLNKSITIPASTPAGYYYLLFYADFRQTVTESNENNNMGYESFSVVAPYVDLTIYYSTVGTSSLAPGGTTTVSAQVENYGNLTSPAGKVGVYLSANSAYDANDVLLDSLSFAAISPSSYDYSSKTITIPSSTPLGTYYVLFYADHQTQITESNENNNIDYYYYLTVTVPSPNLSVSLYTPSPSTVVPGGSTTLSGYVYNYGNVTSPAGNIGFYLSSDYYYDVSDALIGTGSFSSISSGGGSNYFSQSVSIPLATPGGYYYVIAYADYDENITESNENNNTDNSNISINAPYIDLTFYNGSVNPTSVQGGSSVTLTGYVSNQGTSASGSGYVGYYLSNNSSYDVSDIFIDSIAFNTITASNSQYVSKSVTIPGNTASGYYYIIFYSDFNLSITENNETNNTDYYSIYVTGPAPYPDLTVTTLNVVQTVAVAGSTVDFSFIANNSGGQAASAFDVAVFLSSDNVYDVGDVLIKSIPITGLSASSGYQFNGNTTIPQSIVAGNYYLLFNADFQNTVSETSETNNISLSPITITDPVGVNEVIGIKSVALSPNPASEVLNLSMYSEKSDPLSLKIYDVEGRLWIEKNVGLQSGPNQLKLDIGQFPCGSYLVHVVNSQEQSANYRFVVIR